MLTEKQVRRIHKAGVNIRVCKRAPIKSWHGAFIIDCVDDEEEMRIELYNHKPCSEECANITILHELIHAREYLRGRLDLEQKKEWDKCKGDDEDDGEWQTTKEAMLTYATNPQIFDTIKQLWGVVYEN